MGDAPRAPHVTSLPRFLVTGNVAVGQTVALDAEEAQHARVRRLAVGAAVALFDGHGRSFRGTIATISRREVSVALVEELPARSAESVLAITLALATVKADRFEWAIEKATELGVARICPFLSTHSVARPSPARLRRWQQIALSAAKQAGRSIVPVIESPVAFAQIIAPADDLRLLCWERCPELTTPQRAGVPPRVAIIVGPEGGFTSDEAAAARAAGCEALGLGPRILRAETAAIVAVALCQSWWGDVAPAAPVSGPGFRVPS